jgi:protein-arginine kinase activator protein McsA
MDHSKDRYRKCGSCGWIHLGVSRDDAEETIREFNKMYVTLDNNERLELYGGQPANITSYLTCVNCHTTYKDMVMMENSDWKRLRGKTVQPILAE